MGGQAPAEKSIRPLASSGSVWRSVRFWGAVALGLSAVGIPAGSIAASLLVSQKYERAPLAAGSAVIGLVFFLGILMLGAQAEEPFSPASVRHAIAAGFVATYFTLLGFNAWYTASTGTKFAPGLMSTLTDLLQIIIPAYFATEGALQWQKLRQGRTTGEPNATSGGEGTTEH